MKGTAKKLKPVSEPSLKDSELRYRRLFEAAQDGILILDARTGMIEDVNPYLIKMLGYSREEFVEKKLWEVGAFKDIEASQDVFEALQEKETIRYEDLPLRAKDGRLIQVEFVSNVYLMDEEKVIQCNIRNITAHKRAEEALRESEQRLNFHVENSPMAVVEWDTNFIVTRWSGEAEKIFGWRRAETIGKPIMDLRMIYEEDIPIVQNVMQRLNDGISRQVVSTNRNYTKDGKVIYCKWYNSVLKNSQGKMISVMSQVLDITKPKHAVEALRESQQLLEKTLASLLDAVFILDAETVEIINCNPAASAIFGYSRQEMLSRTTAFLHIDQETLEEFRQHLNSDVEEKGFLFMPEFMMKRKDGTVFPSEHSVIPIENEQGKRIGWVSVVRDISERKRAEEEIRRMALLLDAAPNSITVHDFDGQFLYANQKTFDLHGFTRDEFLDLNLHQLDVPDSENLIAPRMQELLDHGEATFQVAHYRKDGSTLPLEVSARVTTWGSKNVILSIATDITERKRAEEALHTSEERFKAIASNTPDHILMQDSELRYSFVVNPQLGLAEKDMVGKTDYDFLSKEEADKLSQVKRQVLETGKPVHLETSLISRAGEPEFFDGTYVPKYDAQGQVDGLIGYFRNVTERKRAEQELDKSEVMYRTLVENIPDYVMRYDRQQRHIFANSRTFQANNVTHEEFIGKTHREMGFDPHLCDRWEKAINKVLETGEPQVEVFDWKNAFGAILSLEWRAYPEYAPDGSIETVLGISRDITDRKHAEEALRNREGMLQKIFDILPVGLWIADKDGQLLRGNPAGVKIWGAAPKVSPLEYGVFKGRRLPSGEEVAPDDWALAHTIRDKVTIVDELLEIDAFDGKKKTILNYTAPVLDAQGDVQGAIVVNQDITERKRAEEALHHNRDLLLALSRAAQAVQRARTPDEVYRVVGEEIKTLGYELMIFTLSDDREHLIIAYTTIAADLLRAAEKLTRSPTQSYRLPIQPESVFGRVVTGERAEFLPSTADTVAQVLPKVLRPLAGQLMTLLKVERGIVAPLHADGATMGVLTVTASALREGDVPAVETFVAQVAISLHNARLTQQTQKELAERKRAEDELARANRFISALSEVGARLQTSLVPDRIMETMGAELKRLGLTCVVVLVKPDGETSVVQYTSFESHLLSLGDRLTGLKIQNLELSRARFPYHDQVIENRRGVFQRNLLTVATALLPNIPQSLIEQAARLFGITRETPVVYLPLIVEDRVLGTLGIWGEGLQEDELPSLSVFANQVAAAMQNARLFHSLAEQREQLRALATYLESARENERARIAREIHDEFGQSMTALKMDLTWLAKRLPEGDKRVERIRGMNTLVDDSIVLLRRIATDLRPNLLDDLGLNAALEWQAQEFSKRSDIPCKLNLPKDDLALDPALNTTLFRIFQETLTNIARHAQATRVNTSLKSKEQNLVLTICDNGRGITEGELNNPRSLGLLGLRERAAQWGGETIFRSVPGEGTTVTIRIPLPASPGNGGKQ